VVDKPVVSSDLFLRPNLLFQCSTFPVAHCQVKQTINRSLPSHVQLCTRVSAIQLEPFLFCHLLSMIFILGPSDTIIIFVIGSLHFKAKITSILPHSIYLMCTPCDSMGLDSRDRKRKSQQPVSSLASS